MKKICQYPAIAFTLFIIVIGSALLDYFLPVMGDDLIFLNLLGLDSYTCPNRQTVSFILAHVFGCNGRLFDYMGPVVINLLPRAIASAIMGLMAGMFYYSILYACRLPRRGYQTMSLFVMTVTLATMPWWDGMYLRVCQFNYSWGATFCLLFIGLFFRNPDAQSRLKLFVFFILGVFAGAAHEQTGVSMCGAFFIWLITSGHYRKLSTDRRYMLSGLLAGTLLTIAPPGIWLRAAQDHVGQTLPLLILTTMPVLLLLLAVILICALTKSGRRYLRTLKSGEWGVTVYAAIFAGIIAVMSGIPGRTGFFTEAASIVALTRMALDVRLHIPRTAAALASVLMVALTGIHFVLSIMAQHQLMREYEDVREAYIESPDGIVYYDFTDRYDVSPLTLFRVKGVADADDYWNLHALQEAYGDSIKVLATLPASFRGRLDTMTDSVSDGTVTVYTSKPEHVVITLDDAVLQYYPGESPRAITAAHLADGRDIWVATPRVLDPGDYSLPVKTSL